MSLSVTAKAQSRVSQSIDVSNILVGEQVHLRTNVVVPDASKKVEYPSWRKGTEIVPGLEVVEVGKVDTVVQTDGKPMQLNRTYTLTAFDSALYAIPPFTVGIDGRQVSSAEHLGLKVESLPVDTLHLDQYPGPYDVAEATFEWSPRLHIVAFLATILALCFLSFAVLLSDRKRRIRRRVLPPEPLPAEVAKTGLETLRKTDALDYQAKVKESYDTLSDILRRYVEKRFAVTAGEQTTSEIIEALTERKLLDAIEKISNVLSNADIAKFAKLQPDFSEFMVDLQNAEDYINETKPQSDNVKPQPIVLEYPEDVRTYLKRRRSYLSGLIISGVLFISLSIYLGFEIYQNFL